MAVPYLLSFGSEQRYKIKNTSHKKWYDETRFRLQLSKIPYLYFIRLVLGALGLAAWLAAQNVGIGTAVPTERLHVEGNLRLQGAFMPNNLPGQPGNLLLSRGAGTPPVWLANGNARDVLLINPLTGEPAWFPNAVCSNPPLNRLTKVTSTGGAQPQICETHWSEAVGPLNYPVLWNTDATNNPNLYAGEDYYARLEVYATQQSLTAIAGFANENPGSHGGKVGILALAEGPQNSFPTGLVALAGGEAQRSYGVYASVANTVGLPADNSIGVWGETALGFAGVVGVTGLRQNGANSGVFALTIGDYKTSGLSAQTTWGTEVFAVTALGVGDDKVIGVDGAATLGNQVGTGIGGRFRINDGESPTSPSIGLLTTSAARGGSTFVATMRRNASPDPVVFPNSAASIVHKGGLGPGNTPPRALVAEVTSNENNIQVLRAQYTQNITTTNAYAVVGFMDRGGATPAANLAVGVLGENPQNGAGDYAIYALGRFAATGPKAFLIDHPLRPAEAFLAHFSMEGPEPYTIYRGSIVTDDEGKAVVRLPDYFEAANKDFHYQLTTVGPNTQAWIIQKIQNNTFIIGTNQPRVEVFWTVTAVRNDPYARHFMLPAEIEKKGDMRGRYLLPELYNAPENARIMPSKANSHEVPMWEPVRYTKEQLEEIMPPLEKIRPGLLEKTQNRSYR
jgi:hypothetical protein